MELFEVINGRAFPSTHALLIEPYKSIWEKDLSDDKGDAVRVFTYVELMCSPKKSNPFFTVEEKIRPAKVRKEVWGDENYDPSADGVYGITDIIGAVSKYKELLDNSAPGYSLYVTAVSTAEKLKDFLDSFDPDERTRAGGLVLKPSDITRALNDIPDTIKKLKEARLSMLAELQEASKTRNQREVGAYER